MLIDFNRTARTGVDSRNRGSWLQSHRRSLLMLCGGLVIAVLFYYLGAYTDSRRQLDKMAARLVMFGPSLARNYIKGKLADPDTMIIDIRQDEFQKLQFKRYEAIQKNLIITEEGSYVPAKINSNNVSYKVDLRLKGDYADHLEGNKWSFRIKVKGENTIYGMKRFSLQSPERSGYLKEWLLYEFLKYEGLIGLRYDFINVIMNGRDLGIFAIEESFSKELIESNNRREGPILKFDEAEFLSDSLSQKLPVQQRNKAESNYYLISDILSFRTEQTLADENLRENFIAGRSLLNRLRNGEVALAEAMDVERAARVFAVLTIMNAYHAVRWKNVRFYFNPVTRKLELIAYNAHGPGFGVAKYVSTLYENWLYGMDTTPEWYDLFFSDENFLRNFYYELKRLTEPGYLEKFFQAIAGELDEKQNILYRDGPLLTTPIGVYFYNRDQVRQLFTFRPKLMVYLDRDLTRGHELHINIAANAPVPLQVHAVRCGHSGNRWPVPVTIQGRYRLQLLKLVPVSIGGLTDHDIASCIKNEVYGDADNLVLDGMELEFSVYGVDNHEKVAIDAYPINMAHQAVPPAADMARILEDYEHTGVITIDREKRTVTLGQGAIRFIYDFYVPAGYTLVGQPGTVLVLDNGAALISLSPVRLTGTAASPFIITSQDGSGQGLLVMSAGAESVLEHTQISNIVNVNRDGWVLTGAATFYEADVRIDNSVIENTVAEDALNIIRSKFRIEHSTFGNSYSDALDIDFGNGTITDTTFTGCTNDCIDVSGTSVQVARVDIDGANDKGISVGEQSEADITAVTIRNANIGIAGKDSSHIRLQGVDITDSGTGLAAYRKKPEFAGARINGEQVRIKNTGTQLEQDELSSIAVGILQ